MPVERLRHHSLENEKAGSGELAKLMKASDGMQKRQRRNSNPKLARIPHTVFTTNKVEEHVTQMKNQNSQDAGEHQSSQPTFFVLRAKDKELLLKMYDKDS